MRAGSPSTQAPHSPGTFPPSPVVYTTLSSIVTTRSSLHLLSTRLHPRMPLALPPGLFPFSSSSMVIPCHSSMLNVLSPCPCHGHVPIRLLPVLVLEHVVDRQFEHHVLVFDIKDHITISCRVRSSSPFTPLPICECRRCGIACQTNGPFRCD